MDDHTERHNEMPGFDSEIPENAVRLYGESDAMDNFPVLKAFQQYIDAEQAKARKRMLLLAVFFGILMIAVISVFVILLLSVSAKNQALNDRMFEFAMKERDRQPAGSAVVVQPPQDNSALLALTSKIEAMQKELAESREKAAKAADEAERARQEAAKPKGPTPQELEIKRLKALLEAEKEKQSAERERQRQIELEEYRRKHYPELYEKKKPAKSAVQKRRSQPEPEDDTDDLLEEVDRILDESEAISYFEPEVKAPSKAKAPSKSSPKSAPAPAKKEYSIPVDVRGSSTRWSVPND